VPSGCLCCRSARLSRRRSTHRSRTRRRSRGRRTGARRTCPAPRGSGAEGRAVDAVRRPARCAGHAIQARRRVGRTCSRARDRGRARTSAKTSRGPPWSRTCRARGCSRPRGAGSGHGTRRSPVHARRARSVFLPGTAVAPLHNHQDKCGPRGSLATLATTTLLARPLEIPMAMSIGVVLPARWR
jgi:hypothetical protein